MSKSAKHASPTTAATAIEQHGELKTSIGMWSRRQCGEARSLREALIGGAVPITERLLHNNLVSEAEGLTGEGVAAAIRALPLFQQADLLGLMVDRGPRRLAVHRPEAAVMQWLEGAGACVAISEGQILHYVIQCAAHRVLWPMVVERRGASGAKRMYHQLMCSLVSFLGNEERVINAVATATDDDIQVGWRYVLQAQFDKSFNFWKIYGFDEGVALAVFRAVGPALLSRVTRVFLLDLYAFSHGWPDVDLRDRVNTRPSTRSRRATSSTARRSSRSQR